MAAWNCDKVEKMFLFSLDAMLVYKVVANEKIADNFKIWSPWLLTLM